MSDVSFYGLIAYPILFILPAWLANAAPVIFSGGGPLDFKKKLGGKPILGGHKTVSGTASGILAGIIVAAIESVFLGFSLAAGIAITLGAIFGDLLGSFIKRRLSLKEGSSVLFMDQYLFFVFALVFSLPFSNLPGYPGIIFILLLTGILHRLMNILAHKAGMKSVPW